MPQRGTLQKICDSTFTHIASNALFIAYGLAGFGGCVKTFVGGFVEASMPCSLLIKEDLL